MALFHYFWLSGIPLYVYMCGYHILFIPSSVDGHLGCFHVLAVLEWTLGYMCLFELWCSLGIYSGVGLTDHIYGHSTSSFLRNLHTVLCSGAQIYIPINNVWVFPFLYMLSNIYYLQTFFFLLQQCFIRVARNWTHISKVCLCIHFKKKLLENTNKRTRPKWPPKWLGEWIFAAFKGKGSFFTALAALALPIVLGFSLMMI